VCKQAALHSCCAGRLVYTQISPGHIWTTLYIWVISLFKIKNILAGHAVGLTAIWPVVIADARVRSQASQAGSVVDEMTLGQVSLPAYFGCPCHYYSTNAPRSIHLNATLMRRTSGEAMLFRISGRRGGNSFLCSWGQLFLFFKNTKHSKNRSDFPTHNTANLCEYRKAVLLALSHLSGYHSVAHSAVYVTLKLPPVPHHLLTVLWNSLSPPNSLDADISH